MTQPLHAALAAGAHSLGLNLSEVQIGQLLDFLALLQKWNRVYNLTAVRERLHPPHHPPHLHPPFNPSNPRTLFSS